MTAIQLHGFNNLTKNLSCSLYKITYVDMSDESNFKQYQAYVAQHYHATLLSSYLDEVTSIIGAHVLNRAHQNYQPHGASVTTMIAEDDVPIALVNHLNKSHICIHSYPETHPMNNTAILRFDLDISTCGVICPLKALNLIIKRFQADIMTIDYRVRGVTRDITGKKHYKDDDMTSITQYLPKDISNNYLVNEKNSPTINYYHLQLARKHFDDIKPFCGSETTVHMHTLIEERDALFNSYSADITSR